MSEVNEHIGKAIEFFKNSGCQQGLAEALGVSQGMVSGMYNKRYLPSWKMAIRIEEVTKGAVNRADLRPDIFGSSVSESDAA